MHEKKAGEHNIITMLTLPQLNHPHRPTVTKEGSYGTPQTPHKHSTNTIPYAINPQNIYTSTEDQWINVVSLSDLLVCSLLGEQSCVDEVCDERGHPQFQSGGNEQC